MTILWLSALGACVEAVDGTVQLTGIVYDAPAANGSLVEGATVTSQNSTGATTGTAETDADGFFSVAVPSGQSFFLTVSGSGYVSTAFSGVAASQDFVADTGYPWLATKDWVAEERALYSGCASESAEGALLTGQVLAVVPAVDEPALWPPLSGATIEAMGSDNQLYPACYLDSEGVLDPIADSTSSSGRYAIFGLPAGGTLLQVTATRSSGESGSDVFEFITPEGGLIPVFPTPLEL